MDGPPSRNGRAYGPPSGASSMTSIRSGPRPPPPQPNPNQNHGALTARAEQFHDERTRIVNSLFMRQDTGGNYLEQYITHIRVVEDARYPTSPPPPDSSQDHKKDRVIILAVRNSGRIRMHKARENVNGSFSIGKTWNFEDLSAIESYSNRVPQNDTEDRSFRWAGNTGFAVTLIRPYFWKANSVQEKSYFVASLAKIYKRYTAGNLPQLVGFTNNELEQIHAYADQTASSTHPPPSRGGLSVPNGSSDGTQPDDSPTVPQSVSSQNSPFNSLSDLNTSSQTNLVESIRPRNPARDQRNPYSPDSTTNRHPPQLSTSEVPPINHRTETQESARPSSRRTGGYFHGQSERPESRDSNDTANTNGLGISGGSYVARKLNGDPQAQRNDSDESLPRVTPAPLPERRRPHLSNQEPKFPEDDGSNVPVPKPLNTRRMSRADDNPPIPPVEPPLKSPQRYAVGASQMSSIGPDGPVHANENKPKEERKLPENENSKMLEDFKTSPKDLSASETNEEVPVATPEELRPGLGRMFGAHKKSTKELIATAARAYNSFKPRAGGAGAKLLATSDPQKSTEPDGITGVVPAPKLLRTGTNDSTKEISTTSFSIASVMTSSPPNVTVTSPPDPATKNAALLASQQKMSELQLRAAELQQQSKEDAAKRKLRRNPQQLKYLERLGVNTQSLDGRGLEYETLLEEFWPQNVWSKKPVDALQADLRREISAVQTGGWFEHIARHSDQRNAAIGLINSAIEECDQLEKLLTIYSVELGGLSDDISYIEAQGQGLQVQTSNQKLLMSELKDLLDTINISPQQIDPLYTANLANIEGLESIERALLILYKALALTDSSIKHGDQSTNMSQMRAIQEQRTSYLNASDNFLKGYKKSMSVVFGAALMLMQNSASNKNLKPNETGIQVDDINAGRLSLWKYSPLVLYTKTIDQNVWHDVIRTYQNQMRTIYSSSVLSILNSGQNQLSKVTGDEQEVLFTGSEAQVPDTLGMATRKMTVKRSQTLARTLRTSSGDKPQRNGVQRTLSSGSYLPFESFEQVLNEITPLVISEQAFIIDFFHTHTTGTVDFAEAVQSILPENRLGPIDTRRKAYEPSAEMTQFIIDSVSDVFSFLPNDLQNFVNSALKEKPLQGIGILQALHSKMATIEDGFFFRMLHNTAARITNDWAKVLSVQIRAIEETNVKVNKRKGVLPFIRVFPLFTGYIENMLPSALTDPGEVRSMVDQGYSQINKAMFNSLRAIAKETPAAHAPASEEDKESLNYHILIIENMFHYVENVETRGDTVLEEGKRKASEEYDEHLSLYIESVTRRPIGKIMDFTETLSKSAAATNPLIANSSANSSTYRKIHTNYDSKELRRGIDTLKKRIEKHFGETSLEEQESSGTIGDSTLLNKVISACEDRYIKEMEKLRELPPKAFGEEIQGIVWSIGEAEIIRWFKGGK